MRWRAMIARRSRRISSSDFPENMLPVITSIPPPQGLRGCMEGIYHGPPPAASASAARRAGCGGRRGGFRPRWSHAGPRAKRGEPAAVAGRRAGVADAASMEDEAVPERDPARGGEQRREVALDPLGVVLGGQAEASRQAGDVGVHD